MGGKIKYKDQYDDIRLLYANGLSVRKISKLTSIANSTVGGYCKGVVRIPVNKRKNPLVALEMMTPEQLKGYLEGVKPTAENLLESGKIRDIDYYLSTFKKGEQFTGPLDKISLEELQKVMETPTDYHSDLCMKDWAKYYLAGRSGRFLKDAPHQWCEIQNEIFDLWEEHQMLMVETFRGIGKTMAADAVLLYEICENPDNNYFIMSETQEKAGFRVKHIADALLTNKKIIADYGFLPHIKTYDGMKQTWRWHRITVKRHFHQTDPTLMAFSSESTVATGAHFAGGVFDDVWSFKLEQNSMRNKRKWLGWRDGELEGCMEHAWELWLLTRKGVTDLYQDMEDRQMHVVYKRPAVIKFPSKYEVLYKKVAGRKVYDGVKIQSSDWKITDDGNKRFSIAYFIEKMTKMDKDKWESEYQLNPIGARGQFWRYRHLRFIRTYDEFFRLLVTNRYRVIGFMDLAFGKSSRADFTALVIVGYYNRKFYFLELFLKRGATERDMVRMMKEATEMFPQIRVIYIEDDLQQSNKVERLRKKAPFVSVQGFSSRQEQARLKKEDSAKRDDVEGKPLRIWCQLECPIEDNRVYINLNMRNFKEFKDEFIAFPSCSHFDVLDALGNAVSILQHKANLFFILSG